MNISINKKQQGGIAASLWHDCKLVLPVLLACITGCGRGSSDNAGGPPGGGAGGPPGASQKPVEVSVITIAPERAVLSVELPGRVSPVREAEVRARVTGILQKRVFKEGAEVQAGEVLFEIDPAPLQASYDSAKASLAKAEASREQAQAKAKRNEVLIKSNGVSQQAYEDAKASASQSEAEVLAAKAALDAAALNLGYTKVTAPISGRIGKALVTEGSLASASEATKLAVVRQLDPVYVDFTQSSAEMLKLRLSLESGRLQRHASNELSITLVLEDGSAYSQPGRMMFLDLALDENTSSATVRGEFPNSNRLLLPGMYVRGRIEVGVEPEALTVPQRAVSRDSYGQASVLVVNAQSQVEQRAIKTGSITGDKWIVSSGLVAGDRVIMEGLQKVRTRSTVTAVPFQANTSEAKKTAAEAQPKKD